MAHLLVGTSGWNYPEWKDGFYAGVPRRRWLQVHAERFAALEVNATFYRTPAVGTLERWRAETPESFRFAIKGHRQITHVRRLGDVGALIREQCDAFGPLAGRIAAVLWQLPAGMHKDLARLTRFAAVVGGWREVRHVLEFRHPSWFDETTAKILAAHGLACAISDAGAWPRWDRVVGDLAYLRLHGRPQTYRSAYELEELTVWAGRACAWLEAGCDVCVFFDNTMEGAAPRDALRFCELANRIMPGAAEVVLGERRAASPYQSP